MTIIFLFLISTYTYGQRAIINLDGLGYLWISLVLRLLKLDQWIHLYTRFLFTCCIYKDVRHFLECVCFNWSTHAPVFNLAASTKPVFDKEFKLIQRYHDKSGSMAHGHGNIIIQKAGDQATAMLGREGKKRKTNVLNYIFTTRMVWEHIMLKQIHEN